MLDINRTRMLSSIVVMCSLGLSACGMAPAESDLSLPCSHSMNLGILSPTTIEKLQEVDTFTIPEATSIAGLKLRSSDCMLLVVNLGNGSLDAWDLDSNSSAETYDLRIVSTLGLAFDEQGDLVVGATSHEFTNANGSGILEEYIGGIWVWDTLSGTPVLCLADCDAQSPEEVYSNDIGAGIDPTGSRAFDYNLTAMGAKNGACRTG